jgi:phosphoribosylanthranilate isomerase
VTRVKICGLTRHADAMLAAELGASAIGLVFWPRSPRVVGTEAARGIVRSLPRHVTAVGVFVDQPLDDVRRVAETVGLGAIQLHGGESLDYARALLQPVIKAVPVHAGFAAASLDAWPGEITILLDAHDPVRRGGTGRTIDRDVAATAAARRPVFLSGGLTPDNIAAAVRHVRPYGVDLSSGVESAPGIKNEDRLRALFGALELTRHV